MTATHDDIRVLSVYPCRVGFAYSVLEGRKRLLDWNIAHLGINTDDEFRRRLVALIDKYHPELVVFEDCSTGRRSEKTQRRIEVGLSESRFRDLQTLVISPGETRQALDLPLRATKHDVVLRVAAHFPELARKAPKRAIWQRDPRMNLFDAVALCIAAH